MGELGDLLELLHDAHARVSTFEIEYRDWSRQRASNEVAVVDSDEGRPRLSWRGGGPWPEEVVTTRRIWLERPDRLRVEILEDELLIRLGVRTDSHWWRWDAVQGTTSGAAVPDEGGIVTMPPLLTPPVLAVHRLPAIMRLEPAGAGEVAGRQATRARGRPRLPNPARGALSYEFEFDAEHGSLLRRAEFEEGEIVWEREARQVVYNARIDPRCFVFVAPDEEQPEHAPAHRPQ